MAFLRLVAATTTTVVVAATTLPSLSSLSSPSPSQTSPSFPTFKNLAFSSVSSNSILRPHRFNLVKGFASPPSALHMDAPSSDHMISSQNGSGLLEISRLWDSSVQKFCRGVVSSGELWLPKPQQAAIERLTKPEVAVANRLKPPMKVAAG